MDRKKETTRDKDIKKLDSQQNQRKASNSPNSNEVADKDIPSGPKLFNTILILFLITFLLNTCMVSLNNSVPEIEYSKFLELVEKGYISNAQLSEDAIQMTIAESADLTKVVEIVFPDDQEGNGINNRNELEIGSQLSTVRAEDPDLVERLTENKVEFSQERTSNGISPFFIFIAMWIIPTLIMYLIYYFGIRKLRKSQGDSSSGGGLGGIFGIGKSKAKEYSLEKNTGISFDDVAGQNEAKESLREMVDFLHNPERYQEIGAKQPKGALLVGPPGTGKTLLAKAVAGEAKVPFYSISGSEFVEMFVGVGASRVRDLFEQAKKNAPCIIFIDEIDAIGKSRDNQYGSNDEREQTLNQLLAEMDGFDNEKGIIVLAATNRPEVLDKALLRPGRFDRRIIVDKPDLPGREGILEVHAKKVKLTPKVDLHEIALASSGATGADLANMINEAALLAVKEGRAAVEQRDLMEAVEVVIAGKEKKDRIMNTKEREMVAYHEVGHALTSALQKKSQPVQKITIVPRTMGSLGYTMNVPEEERYLLTQSEIRAQITTLLGGRAAELIIFGEVTTGAANDIERATELARNMVAQYGMSDSVGPMKLGKAQSQYLGGDTLSTGSEEANSLIDKEVRSILVSCQEDALSLLRDNDAALHRISECLLEKESITGEEFMTLLKAE